MTDADPPLDGNRSPIAEKPVWVTNIGAPSRKIMSIL